MTSSAKDRTHSRIVIDSNVWISAMVFGGVPRAIFEKIVHNNVTVVVSEELLTEVRRILHAKFPEAADELDILMILGDNIARVSLGAITVDASRDADDNKILETAVLGSASTIISGDNDLLDLRHYGKITIQTPAEFIKTA